MAEHTTLEMGARSISRVHPLGDAPDGAAAQAAAPARDNLLSKWLLCVFAPFLGFAAYRALAHIFFNHGHLVELHPAVIFNNLTVNTNEFQNTVELGGFLDYRAGVHKTGHVHPVADVVGFNLSINYFENQTISSFTSYANFSIGSGSNTTRVVFEPRVFHLPKEMVMLIEDLKNKDMLRVMLLVKYKWHVKEREIELGHGEFRHTEQTCEFLLGGNPRDGKCGLLPLFG